MKQACQRRKWLGVDSEKHEGRLRGRVARRLGGTSKLSTDQDVGGLALPGTGSIVSQVLLLAIEQTRND